MNFDPYTGKPITPARPPWWRRNLWAIIACAALFLVGIGVGSAGGNSDTTAAGTVTVTSQRETVTVTDTVSVSNNSAASSEPATTETSPPDTSSWTVSQQNAVRSAQSYLSTQPFSRAGLIKQLSSSYGEGFPKKDAIFAVNHIKVNWNEEAAKAAKQYLQNQAFSRAGLIQQLESSYGDGYTHSQAVYGVNHAGL